VQTVKVIAVNYELPLALWSSHPRCTDMWASRQRSLTRNVIPYFISHVLDTRSSIPGVWYLENFCVCIAVCSVRAYHSRACVNPIHLLKLFSRARHVSQAVCCLLSVPIRILKACSHSRYTPPSDIFDLATINKTLITLHVYYALVKRRVLPLFN
jgi:hypothetical protein